MFVYLIRRNFRYLLVINNSYITPYLLSVDVFFLLKIQKERSFYKTITWECFKCHLAVVYGGHRYNLEPTDLKMERNVG
mgnify:CR=1 FL=1